MDQILDGRRPINVDLRRDHLVGLPSGVSARDNEILYVVELQTARPGPVQATGTFVQRGVQVGNVEQRVKPHLLEQGVRETRHRIPVNSREEQ